MKTVSLFGIAGLSLGWLGLLAEGQAPVPPKMTPAPTPKPRPPFADSNQIVESGSFEVPHVFVRTPAADLPKLLTFWQGEWTKFGANLQNKTSEVIGGVTNEAGVMGKQSLYVEFRHAQTPGAGWELASALVAIKPAKTYRVNIWGKLDPKSPILIDHGIPMLRLSVEFFQADGTTQTGEPKTEVQPIPGTPNRIFFWADRWSEFYINPVSPDDAAFVKVTWAVTTPVTPSDTNGVLLLDGAGIAGEKVEPAPDEPAPDASTPTSPGLPGTPAAVPDTAKPAEVK